MANEMIRRVAHAIAEGGLRALQERMGYSEEHIKEQAEAFTEGYVDYARYAVKAMREPTEAMLQATNDLEDDFSRGSPIKIWQAMIDAALRDQ
jgi:hypothetical protein